MTLSSDFEDFRGLLLLRSPLLSMDVALPELLAELTQNSLAKRNRVLLIMAFCAPKGKWYLHRLAEEKRVLSSLRDMGKKVIEIPIIGHNGAHLLLMQGLISKSHMLMQLTQKPHPTILKILLISNPIHGRWAFATNVSHLSKVSEHPICCRFCYAHF